MVVQMFATRQQRQAQKASSRLSRERAREQLLAMLPERTYQVATFSSSPAQIFASIGLESLLEEMMLSLQVNSTLEFLRTARSHLNNICNAADSHRRSFDATVENLEDGAQAKVHIRALGATTEDEDEELLKRIIALASSGGIFQRTAIEAVLLHRLTLGRENGDDIDYSLIDCELVRRRADEIISRKQELQGVSLRGRDAFTMTARGTIRSLSRDSTRTRILAEFSSRSTDGEKVRLLQELFGDSSTEAVHFLLEVVFDATQSDEVREIACCSIEGIAQRIPLYEANEVARKLLARMTRYCVTCKFVPFDASLSLRLLGSIGKIEVGTVVAQLLESDDARGAYRGDPMELAILLMVLELLGRGGTATRSLEKLVLGIGLEHLSDSVSELVRAKAAESLFAQHGGTKTLIQLLDFYAVEDEGALVPTAIAGALARDDSAEKVVALLEMGREAIRTSNCEQKGNFSRILKALRNTQHPDGVSFLQEVILDVRLPSDLRFEAALSIRCARGGGVAALIEALPSTSYRDRAIIIEALSGKADEGRMGALVELFSAPFEPREGTAAVQEQSRLLRTMTDWRLL